MTRHDTVSQGLETRMGRLLIALTYVSVAVLVVGVALMATNGISPLDGGPKFDLGAIPSQVAAFAPVGFLWVGLLAVISAPISRVVGAAIGSARSGDRWLVVVAIAILLVIAVAVATALVAGS